MRRRDLAFGLLLVALLAPAAGAQSLGDVAQRERARRAKLKSEGARSTPTVDDEALKANRGQLANDPGAPAADASESKPAPKSAAGQPVAAGAAPTTEEAWRRTMAQARANLDDMTRQYELLAGAHLATGEYFVDPRTGENLIGGPERLKQLVAGAKHEMQLAQQQVDELLERARREHVPPGWLR